MRRGAWRSVQTAPERADSVLVIERYFRSGASVCPFAKIAALHFVEVSTDAHRQQARIVEALRGFVSTPGSNPPGGRRRPKKKINSELI